MAGAADVEVESLTKRFGTREVLASLSLRVSPGRFVAVMGPSGSGKSTLLHLVAGLARPDSGHVRIDGVTVDAMSEPDAARLRRYRIGFVFQSFNLIPVLSARENVALPGRIAGLAAAACTARADELLVQVGLGEVADQRPGELSGGEQQRVALARALMMRPGVVLADEPTGSLDAETGASVLSALRALQHVEGTTVVMVTHDPRSAAVADELVRLENGAVADRLALDGWAPAAGRDGMVEPEERTELVLSWLRGRSRRRRRPSASVAGSLS